MRVIFLLLLYPKPGSLMFPIIIKKTMPYGGGPRQKTIMVGGPPIYGFFFGFFFMVGAPLCYGFTSEARKALWFFALEMIKKNCERSEQENFCTFWCVKKKIV